jgi:hypothetical protein
MTCQNCKFSAPYPRIKLIREVWEEDPRPIRKGWKATWWNPADYKDADPYEYEDFFEVIDKAREIDNNTLIYCDRYPKRQVVTKSYKCGEYQEG